MKKTHIVISLVALSGLLAGGVAASKLLNSSTTTDSSSNVNRIEDKPAISSVLASSTDSSASNSISSSTNSVASSSSTARSSSSSTASASSSSTASASSSSTASASSSTQSNEGNPDVNAPVVTPAVDTGLMRQPVNWRLSSELKPYPTVAAHPNLCLHVSTARQRVYVMDGPNLLYTMYASTGDEASGNGTPRGTFHIQAQRGRSFYNPKTQGGANNWVSFLGHGVYLFHSVPVYENGQYILSEAAKLGHKGASHGCVRLSVADSAWIYNHIKYNTKVVID